MNTYQWTCKGCETPNVLVHDPEKEEQIALSCLKCGTPGLFEPVSQTVIMRNLEVAQCISTYGSPRVDSNVAPITPSHWRI